MADFFAVYYVSESKSIDIVLEHQLVVNSPPDPEPIHKVSMIRSTVQRPLKKRLYQLLSYWYETRNSIAIA